MRRVGLIVIASAGLLLALLAMVAVRHGRPLPADLAVHRWAVRHRPGGLREPAAVVTATGVGVVPYVLAVVAGVISGSGRYGRVLMAARTVAVLLVVQLLRFALVTVVGRQRPPVGDWAVHVTGFAFPSGHTVTSATAAAILLWAVYPRLHGVSRTVVVSCVVTWAVAVGLSRVYLGVHWPTDVVGGWAFTVVLLGSARLVFRGPAMRRGCGDADVGTRRPSRPGARGGHLR
jgi:membrane-associated phospholipid phosphatase